jgi:hypothetical protein
MPKNKHHQLAIVRRLRGPRRSRTQIGMRVPLLFAVIAIIAMTLDMCAFPPAQRNIVLAETCPEQAPWAENVQTAKSPPPVEKTEACQ